MNKEKRLVLVGTGAYLAQGLAAHLPGWHIDGMEWQDWEDRKDVLAQADWVINFCLSPQSRLRPMGCEEIIDVRLAKTIAHTKVRYIFISSRKVYGSSCDLRVYNEESNLHPAQNDFYALNKMKAEKLLGEMLGDRLFVARVSNIIGEPVIRKDYRTFMGWICTSFLEVGKVVCTQNRHAVKDFITKKWFHRVLKEVMEREVSGTYNISAGFGTEVGEVLEGYVGAEHVEYAADTPCDQFVIVNDKLLSKIPSLRFTKSDLMCDLADYKNQLAMLKNPCFN